MNNLKTTNIADLKVGDIFQTHSGAEFKVINEFKQELIGRKKISEQLVQSLETGIKLLISNFENTIILK